jgi:hypothetical protein
MLRSLLTAAALLTLAVGIGLGAYRIFGGNFNVISAGPHPEPSPANGSFAVRVEANQSIGSIAKQYLGAFDGARLQQIKALNPWLTNPDHIEAGKELLLPGARPKGAVSPADDQGKNGKAQ